VRVSRAEVEHIAELARLEITDEEVPFLQHELSCILDEVAKMSRLDTSQVAPTSHVIRQSNVVRPDAVGDVLSRDAILNIAPGHRGDYYSVPSILQMESDGIAN
jgi:aspartyl-tRNA(Asn)/glutamyl-tRNA(Gln) amidotransferase subunit C